jgi:hypothetical protein
LPRGQGRRDGKSLLAHAQAQAQAGDGAGALFARLDATETRGQRSAEVLLRLAERIRDGAWSNEIAELLLRAETLERTLKGQ